MRKRFEAQLKIGIQPISEVVFDKRDRDDLPQLLAGLQHVFLTPEINEQVFNLLEAYVYKDKKKTGCYGMSLWEVLVIGVLRVGLNIDYARLMSQVNNHAQIRGILGVHVTNGDFENSKYYSEQTLRDNVHMIDEEFLIKLNTIVATTGVKLKKKENEEQIGNEPVDKNRVGKINLSLKVDSFVVESNIHFPTDLNLLWDSIRKAIETTMKVRHEIPMPGTRKLGYWLKKAKKVYRIAAEIHRKKGTNYKTRLKKATQEYLLITSSVIQIIAKAIKGIRAFGGIKALILAEIIEKYKNYMLLFSDQIERRILKGETIPHSEKVFSIFEEHVEWIYKGKAGKFVEFGHPVVITSDESNFILDFEVMIGEVDKQVGLRIGKRVYENYKEIGVLKSISYDKGFYTGPTKQKLKEYFDLVIMPKPGKKTLKQEEEEIQKDFVRLKRKHSAVEANINELEHCGLDKIRDKGLTGFKKYVAWSVLAYNIKHLGKVVKEKNLNNSFQSFSKAA